MGQPTKVENSVLHDLASRIKVPVNPELKHIRESSVEKLNNTRFPTSRDEDWRFLNLKPITRTEFHPLSESGTKPVSDPEQYFIPESENTRLVFVNGSYNRELSSVENLPEGVIVGNLSDNVTRPAAEKYLNKLADYENDPFVQFNGSFFEDGGFIYLPENSTVDAPIQILNLYSESEKAFIATPRLLVVAE
ncbi:MAG: hypothetical protein WEC12_05130, partial [Balneolaceae bacterium]